MTASVSLPSISHCFAVLVLSFTSALVAQSALATPSVLRSASLPDSPGALFSAERVKDSSSTDAPIDSVDTAPDEQPKNSTAAPSSLPPALPRVKLISPGQPAPAQTAHDKLLLGLRESATPYSMSGWFLSSGWSHLIDSSPNYGVDRRAYAQRLGAAAALNSSKEIFSDAILATAFHQDPRYYQRGHTHRFINRVAYAATRPVIGRTDSGRPIPNYAFILGTGGAVALTQTYYPERNRNGGQVAQTWITSLGGSSLGYLVSEFGGDVFQWLHIRKRE